MKLLIVKHLAKNLGVILGAVLIVAGAGQLGYYLFASHAVGFAVLAVVWAGWMIVRLSIDQARWEKEEQDRIERIVIQRLKSFGQQ